MTLIECLMKTGLTRHESELYVALSREGEMNGYEAAKATGIPRANAYQALAGLTDKGGAYIIEGQVIKYVAVPANEYCENIRNRMAAVLEQIKRECPSGKTQAEPYITITGFRHIVDKMKNIITQAKERVYISLSEADAALVHDELKDACERGLKVVAICSGDPMIKGAIIHRINKNPGQIRLIADSTQVLTGEITGSEDDTCLYSRNKPLVELIKESLKNEIKLAQMEAQTHE
jgi:sugar-specific transcriptional regulator TrmB